MIASDAAEPDIASTAHAHTGTRRHTVVHWVCRRSCLARYGQHSSGHKL